MILHNPFFQDWYCQPNWTIGSLNSVPITPAVLIVLNIIIEDEDISLTDLMKVAAPRDIIGLVNYAFHNIAPIAVPW